MRCDAYDPSGPGRRVNYAVNIRSQLHFMYADSV